MKDKTKDQINEIARLLYNEKSNLKMSKGFDFHGSIFPEFWNMALIAYVQCFPKHRDLLRYKI